MGSHAYAARLTGGRGYTSMPASLYTSIGRVQATPQEIKQVTLQLWNKMEQAHESDYDWRRIDLYS
jgi:hypothetical protein